MSKDRAYITSPYPKIRRLIADAAYEGKKINIIHAFGEIDITNAKMKTDSEKISLISYLVHCTAASVKEKIEFNSYKKGNKIITFNEVDISLIFEVEIDGIKYPMNYIIRNAGGKSLMDIDAEIKNVKSAEVKKNFLNKEMRMFCSLPRFLRRIIWRRIMRNPFLIKKYLGTIGITSLHTINAGEFWGIPLSPLNLTLTFGGVYNKAVRVKDEYTEREFLSVTASVNHDLIDGASGKRFFKYIKRKVESLIS